MFVLGKLEAHFMFVQQHWHHRGDDLRRAISNFNPEIYEFQADSKLMIFCWTTKDTKCKRKQTRSYRYVVQLHAGTLIFGIIFSYGTLLSIRF